MEKIRIEVDKVILYYMDRVDPDGNLYRFYVYKDMASEIEYFCTEYDYSNPGENEQVAYFINYCLNQDKDGEE